MKRCRLLQAQAYRYFNVSFVAPSDDNSHAAIIISNSYANCEKEHLLNSRGSNGCTNWEKERLLYNPFELIEISKPVWFVWLLRIGRMIYSVTGETLNFPFVYGIAIQN